MIPNRHRLPRQDGTLTFTLIEMCVVIAIIGVVPGLLLPALGVAKSTAVSAKCLNHFRQLQLCWPMYGTDPNDQVPPNRSEQVNGIWRSTGDSRIGESGNPCDPSARSLERGLLFRYDCNCSVALYPCRADRSRVQRLTGGLLPQFRTRSYSMSGCLGGTTAPTGSRRPRSGPARSRNRLATSSSLVSTRTASTRPTSRCGGIRMVGG